MYDTVDYNPLLKIQLARRVSFGTAERETQPNQKPN